MNSREVYKIAFRVIREYPARLPTIEAMVFYWDLTPKALHAWISAVDSFKHRHQKPVTD